MKSIFIKDDDVIEFEIFFAKNKDGEILVGNKKDALLEREGVDKETLEEHKLSFKYPNHGDMTDIFSRSVKVGSSGISIDPVAARSNRLVVLLRNWTFVDDKGNKLPITEKNIKSLHPSLADFILVEFEDRTGIV